MPTTITTEKRGFLHPLSLSLLFFQVKNEKMSVEREKTGTGKCTCMCARRTKGGGGEGRIGNHWPSPHGTNRFPPSRSAVTEATNGNGERSLLRLERQHLQNPGSRNTGTSRTFQKKKAIFDAYFFLSPCTEFCWSVMNSSHHLLSLPGGQ